MTTSILRQKLHNYLEVADDKKIKAIYTMMETDVEQTAFTYNDTLKTELDKRLDNYKSGKELSISAVESKKRINEILKTASKQ